MARSARKIFALPRDTLAGHGASAMKLASFWLAALDSEAEIERLNVFLASHRVVQVEKAFCQEPAGWSVLVEYVDGPVEAAPTDKTKKRIDYKEVLDPASFQIFAALREWRKGAAREAQIPLFTVAQNRHLAEVAERRISTLAGLGSLHGFGESRVRRYGEAILAAAKKARETLPGAGDEA